MRKLKIPTKLTSLARKSITEHILGGRLDENFRLTEEFLSGQLGIRESSIREALNRIEVEGLIRTQARRGAYLRASVKYPQGYLKANDKAIYIREGVSFHRARARATCNAGWCDVLENIRNPIWLFRRKTCPLPSAAAPEVASNSYDALIEALHKVDQPAAENIVSRHFQAFGGPFSNTLRKRRGRQPRSPRKLSLASHASAAETRPEV